jgi:TRAP-type C4-dicarboxylate transport system permease small subunit
MNQRESRQTDIAMMIAGLILPVGGFLITRNAFVHPPGDPRGEPWYDVVVLSISIALGALLFVIGLVRLLQARSDRGS